jgi:hypothetical protein
MDRPILDRRIEGRRSRMARRRRYPRVRLGFEGFYEGLDRMMIGRGKDLNLRGAFFHTAVPDAPGSEAIVRLILPGSITLMKLQAQVVHANEDPSAGPVGMGLRFIGALPWQIMRIAALLLDTAGTQGFPAFSARRFQRRSTPCVAPIR